MQYIFFCLCGEFMTKLQKILTRLFGYNIEEALKEIQEVRKKECAECNRKGIIKRGR